MFCTSHLLAACVFLTLLQHQLDNFLSKHATQSFILQLAHFFSRPVGNVNTLFTAHFQGTGNVLLDMEQQLQANSIRIKVLEQENTALHSSLVKLKEKVPKNGSRVGLIKFVV